MNEESAGYLDYEAEQEYYAWLATQEVKHG